MFYVNSVNPGYINPAGDAKTAATFLLRASQHLSSYNQKDRLQQPSARRVLVRTEYADEPRPRLDFSLWAKASRIRGALKTDPYYAWAVRDGDVGRRPGPRTYAMMLAGLCRWLESRHGVGVAFATRLNSAARRTATRVESAGRSAAVRGATVRARSCARRRLPGGVRCGSQGPAPVSASGGWFSALRLPSLSGPCRGPRPSARP